MVKGGEAFSHKCSTITSIKISNPNFHKEFVTLDHSSRVNVRADWKSRNATDSSNWKLHHKVYLKITKSLGTPTVDLFASRLCHQPDPNSFVTDVMQQDWNKMFGFAFPSFSLIGWVISKVLWANVEVMILVTPTRQTKPWYTLLLRMSIAFTSPTTLLLNPLGEKHPLVKTRSLRLAAWKLQENPGNGRNFKQCSQTYLLVQETRFNCGLSICLEQVG